MWWVFPKEGRDSESYGQEEVTILGKRTVCLLYSLVCTNLIWKLCSAANSGVCLTVARGQVERKLELDPGGSYTASARVELEQSAYDDDVYLRAVRSKCRRSWGSTQEADK